MLAMFSPDARANEAASTATNPAATTSPQSALKPASKTASKAAPVILVAELAPEFQVKLEGEVLKADVSRDQAGAMLVRAEPIGNPPRNWNPTSATGAAPS